MHAPPGLELGQKPPVELDKTRAVRPVSDQHARAGAVAADPAQVKRDPDLDPALRRGLAAELAEELRLELLGDLYVELVDQSRLVGEVVVQRAHANAGLPADFLEADSERP